MPMSRVVLPMVRAGRGMHTDTLFPTKHPIWECHCGTLINLVRFYGETPRTVPWWVMVARDIHRSFAGIDFFDEV